MSGGKFVPLHNPYGKDEWDERLGEMVAVALTSSTNHRKLYINKSLFDYIDLVLRWTNRMGGEVRSRQIVAVLIITWVTMNPEAPTHIIKEEHDG